MSNSDADLTSQISGDRKGTVTTAASILGASAGSTTTTAIAAAPAVELLGVSGGAVVPTTTASSSSSDNIALSAVATGGKAVGPIANISSKKSSSNNRKTTQPRTTEKQLPVKHNSATKMKTCKFFFSNRGCAHGSSCKFSHDLDSASIAPATSDSSKENCATPVNTTTTTTTSGDDTNCEPHSDSSRVELQKKGRYARPLCKFYAAGYCKWGNRCGFLHSTQPSKPQSSTRPRQHHSQKLSEITEQELKVLRQTEITQLKKRYPKRTDVDSQTYRFVFRLTDPDWPFDVKSINLELSFPDLYPKHIMSASIFDEDCLPSTLARHICKKMNDWLTDKLVACQKEDKVELILRPFLRWLDKTAEQIFTDGLSMYKREMAAKAAGFTFISHTKSPTSSDVNIESEKENDKETVEVLEEGASASDGISEMDNQFRSAVVVTDDISESCPDASNNTVYQNTGKLNPAKRGTELRLKNLQLLESAATLHCTILRTGIRCTRCKTIHHITMHPEKPYVVVCDKCRSKMSLVYHANLMHTASSTVGFFDLNACQPFDLILQDCQLVASCLDCDREILVHGLHAEQEKQFWCTSCHKKMVISVEKGSYIVLNDGAPIKIGADAVLIAKKAKAKSDLKILAEGRQLPDKGACLHYKKSYRWFRFPCCGKLYPCDKCHDEKETDHEMEMANRMICGFCSKEQGFSLTRPCVSCDSSLTRSKSHHWEGGQGCRNKVAMAKTDKQKFAGSNKTVSKKAEAIRKKSGKKTTHIRHAV